MGQNDDPEQPKAHLNYLVFNDEMQLVPEESGSVQVPPAAINGWAQIVPAATGIQGQVAITEPGYIVVYIDNQSIGKDVWFDNVHVEHYTSEVLEEDHYYPYGLCLSSDAGGNTTKQPYKYQGIELNKDFNLETYETKYRGLDPQIGRFRQIDPKAEKHYSISPLASMGDNPALNKDPLGDDWFVNSTNGNVIFVKNTSEVSQELFSKLKIGGNAKDYERFGPDNMFGNKVSYNGKDVLKHSFFPIDNPEEFMNEHGYAKAENVTIKEREFVSGGPMDGEERISQIITDMKQIGDSKITYATPDKLNTKRNIQRKESKGDYSSIRRVSYDLTKPFGQKNSKTAEYFGNRNPIEQKGINVLETIGHFIHSLLD